MKIKLLSLLGILLSNALIAQGQNTACSDSITAAQNKCDLIPCTFDRECKSNDCKDNNDDIPFSGRCWSRAGRPASCDTSSLATFYRC